MIFFAILLKAVAWIVVFRSAVRAGLAGMVARATAVTLLLTAIDKFSVAGNLAFSAILLTLLLYAIMSFILIPVAWRFRNRWLAVACNAAGAFGALAGVNFTMDFIRSLL